MQYVKVCECAAEFTIYLVDVLQTAGKCSVAWNYGWITWESFYGPWLAVCVTEVHHRKKSPWLINDGWFSSCDTSKCRPWKRSVCWSGSDLWPLFCLPCFIPCASSWQFSLLLCLCEQKFPELKFKYVEEDQPEDFFIPYVWSLVFNSGVGLHWSQQGIELFSMDSGWNTPAAANCVCVCLHLRSI